MILLLRHASRFLVVGLCAMAVHFLLVIVFVNLEVQPLVANVFAFLAAFQVSFWGHSSWSFADICGSRGKSMLRFFAVAVGSFLLNELLFAGLLQWTTLPYQLALVLVLGFVAGITFLLSKFWAFQV
ncbi:GtrA family protein [Verrucomicrobiaceae bacterium R5-34]|uniref:GtrA family protein n=1 Tax=Oceaniferula flava TaxID=2800421 RepID=A0AAE2SDA4_9BACT|nr:GtrA family protein [Oceaniferula flavus]MBK1830333.1 GtrA family protein [Verrucomicrobiaceae bacterium R5-34]MBK1854425.1 GtrA family protein [Oceaniferula flavus]MBM1135731.1 GtrA family protein [Oceaniferula flavus]